MGPDLPPRRLVHLPNLSVSHPPPPPLLPFFFSPTSANFHYPTGIAILRSLEHRLYDPDPQELRAVLAGSSIVVPPLHLTAKHLLKAEMVFDTIEVDDAGEGMSGGGGRYGIEEARLFRELEEGEWKESAFDRLVKRELDSAT